MHTHIRATLLGLLLLPASFATPVLAATTPAATYPPLIAFEQSNDFPYSTAYSVKDLGSWHARADYFYSTYDQNQSRRANDTDYEVIVFSSTSDALQYNAAPMKSPWKSVPAEQRLTPEERKWFESDPNSGLCSVSFSLVYRNLVLTSTGTGNDCGESDPVTGQLTLVPMDEANARDTLSWLLHRARTYSPPTAAQRNKAFAALLRKYKQVMGPCVSQTLKVYNEALQYRAGRGTPYQVSDDANMAQAYCGDAALTFTTQGDQGVPPITLDPSLSDDARVRHLVYTEMNGAASARSDADFNFGYYARALADVRDGQLGGADPGPLYDTFMQQMRDAADHDTQVTRQITAIAHAWHVNLP